MAEPPFVYDSFKHDAKQKQIKEGRLNQAASAILKEFGLSDDENSIKKIISILKRKRV